ncbi:4'-phosphopantetheinyl transferase family protein [Sphingomonas sp. PAMC 26621]|uniref:4'-phosphopantetheinyl transferase family protein n=1 Tax=Sphingomonas sp. PAMC 26621 TaxID=1112213 RepID=UPI000289B0A1|nr:4'-phosphopantetheinyl transferase superfamily protein [Sphingomonas sp. PAMC 26621]
MTPLWHDGAVSALRYAGTPVVWRVADDRSTPRHAHASALLAHCADVPADTVRLARSAAGAPRVLSPPGWYIGFAGRGGWSLVGAATRPIAVDRETVDGAAPLWDMLSATEVAALRALDSAEQPRAWLRRWTIKEAHAKLIGEPRRLAPETIETQLLDPVRATATCEGRSHCWTRDTGKAIDTVALWEDDA